MSDANAASTDLREKVEAALEEHVRPELRADGGDVEFLGIDEGDIVQVRLLGTCQGCSPSIVYTITMAIEAALKAHVPEVRLVEALP
ncbi:NifU family protein [Singulisphaera sp. PoT]|uniref:NifU family protein n=1 Tax=Singulisphaera sp. PoT TaxID=3411797 RepID=UPI003BF60E0E